MESRLTKKLKVFSSMFVIDGEIRNVEGETIPTRPKSAGTNGSEILDFFSTRSFLYKFFEAVLM